MQEIPDREPISDVYSGYVVQVEGIALLTDYPHADSDVMAGGDLVIRYGIPLLGKPHLSIVPDLVALDYGDMLTGVTAWEFLLKRSNLHPRADVLGYRENGSDDMIVVKRLDMVAPIHVLVYPDEDSRAPIANPKAIIADTLMGIPERILDYLAYYPNIDDWLGALDG